MSHISEIDGNRRIPTREPQCRTQAECLRRFADVLDMCDAAKFDRPGECTKFDGVIGRDAWSFELDSERCEFAIAIVEGRPVFRGDSVCLDGHRMVVAKEPPKDRLSWNNNKEYLYYEDDNLDYCNANLKRFTWTPPKPATISVNGVEVKRPHKGIAPNCYVFNDVWWVQVPYEDKADAEAFKKAIEGGN